MDMIDSSYKDIICMVIRGHILGGDEDSVYLFRKGTWIILDEKDITFLKKIIIGDGEDFISDTWKDALKIFRGESSE